jgi:hypothetical protein
MSDPSISWSSIGPHLYRFEPPDVVHFQVNGKLDGAAMQRMFDVVRERAAHVGRPVFWLSCMEKFDDFTSEARQIAVRTDVRGIVVMTAVYGGSFRQRILANLAIKASAVLQIGNPPVRIFAGEAEARAHIDEVRRAAQRR